jgi:hypothetical protein
MSVPTRGIGTNDIPPPGGFRVRKHTYTLASYSAAGATAPAEGDIVSFSSGADDRVVLAPDNTTGGFGRVIGKPNTVDLTVDVEWLDVYAFVELDTDDATSVTLGNSLIKDGNTTVVNNFDGGAAAGNLIAISKGGAAAGACKVCAAVLITGK